MRITFIKEFLLYFLLIICSYDLLAKSTPKFALIPLTPTQINLPANGNATVQYTVTNNTLITRTLTMVPIQGVSQVTTGSGACANPFTLAHNQSCTLTLNIDGSAIPPIIGKGPVICKTNLSGNTPDPFLCSQPSAANSLNITRGPETVANISANPTTLQMLLNSTNTIIVTNNSPYITAKGIILPLPPSWTDVTDNVSNCVTLPPLQSCTITITTGSTTYSPTINYLVGENTSEIKVTLSVVEVFLTVNPDNIEIPANDTTGVTVTITNTSTTVTATNVSAVSPWSDVTITPTGCTSIAPLGTCTMKFVSTSASTHGQQSINISGDNTDIVTLLASVIGSDAPLLVKPQFTLLARNFTPQPITIQNQSTSITATNVQPSSNGNVTFSPASCGTLAPQKTCTVTVTPQVASTGLESITVTGTNASTETVSYQIVTYGDTYEDGLVFAICNGTPLYGAVVNGSDIGSKFSWGAQIANNAIDVYNGLTNTVKIIAIPANQSNIYPAYICSQFGGTTQDWYSPAICQLSDGQNLSPPQTCNYRTMPNMYNNLYLAGLGNFRNIPYDSYWSSTVDTSYPNSAFVFDFARHYEFPQTISIVDSYVRCARNFGSSSTLGQPCPST